MNRFARVNAFVSAFVSRRRDKLNQFAMVFRARSRRARRRLVVPIRRAIHLREDAIRDATVDGLRRDVDTLTQLLGEEVRQNEATLKVLKDLRDRFDFYEAVVPELKTARRRLDKRRGKGILILPGRNGH